MDHRIEMILLLSLLMQRLLICIANNTTISYKDALVKDRIEEKFRLLGPRALLKHRYYDNVSDDCARDLAVYEKGIDRQEPWALQMIDSSSKLPTGILRGNIIDIGMYDECIETHGVSMEGIEISGQHCMYSINRMISFDKRIFINPMLSICMPIRCTSDDLVRLINGSINSESNLKSFELTISSANCNNTNYVFIDNQLIISSVIVLLYIGFLIYCTVLHLKSMSVSPEKNCDDQTTRTLSRFSYVKNAKAILSLKISEKDLPVVHGLRALNILWLILLHESLFHMFHPLVNFMDVFKLFASWQTVILLMGVYTVDTFFVLSGFLSAMAYFKERQRNVEFNILSFYVHRFFRLAPSIAAMLYFTIVLMPKIQLITSGPRYEWFLNIFVTSCNSKWLPVLFFISNLVDQDNYCLLQLWSVAVDMQLFWISPLILYTLHKKPIKGIYLLMILLLASVLSCAFVLIKNRYSAIYFTRIISIPRLLEAFQSMYEMPYTRASPWLLGILLGYISTKKTLHLNKKIFYLGWLLAVASFSFCIIGTKTFTNVEYEYNLLWEITFVLLSKPLWAFGICWIIYASIYNPHGLVTVILSSKYFLPLSRISYSLAVIHVIFPLLQAATAKTPKYLSNFLLLHSYIGNLVLDIVAAFLFSITFEMPMRTLGDMILKRKSVSASREKLKDK